MKNRINVYDFGSVPYRKMWDLQKKAQQRLIDQKKHYRDGIINERPVNDMLFFVEHPHVYTLGKSGDQAHLLRTLAELAEIDAEFIEIDRGGDITYHGPGQIVSYPILDLDRHFTDIHKYLRFLEEVVIRTCLDYGIEASRIEGLTGVWSNGEKVCAMGIRCSRWVTMHGFALNVNTDLSYFSHIVPCGISNRQVTSLSALKGRKMNTKEVKKRILRHFADVFDVEINEKDSLTDPKFQISYL
ncbi:MAG: lipoyl(octanoyl) transferase LipB [Balneolaceae bacterium]|nr:lipoyl(octanoyl) transferase LipB [Balneolaceae bacterium]